MPDKSTLKRVKQDRKRGDSASTQAGEFVRQEMDHIREGKHGAKNAKQAIAIGLSEARRAGIDVKRKGQSAAKPTRKKSPATKVRRASTETRARRSKAALKVLKREPRRAASHLALSRQAHAAARKRTPAERSRAAKKGARTRAANR